MIGLFKVINMEAYECLRPCMVIYQGSGKVVLKLMITNK